jgi:hypothetical protein
LYFDRPLDFALGNLWATLHRFSLFQKKALLGSPSKQLAILPLMDTYKRRYLDLKPRWKSTNFFKSYSGGTAGESG